MPVRRTLLLLGMCLAAAAFGGASLSGATFTDSSAQVATVSAANDWTPPTVSVTHPGPVVRGAVTLAATATDTRGTVASVVLQQAPVGGGGWTTICTVTASPYACPWATAALPDGPRDLRAIATDDSGYSATSVPVTTLVDNTAPSGVSLSVPASSLSGTLPLTASAQDAHSGIARLAVEYRSQGAGPWIECGAGTRSPFTCSFDSTGVANGTYELRATAADAAGNQATGALVTRTVDNPVSSVSISSPVQGSTVTGTATLTAAATSNRGVTSVRFETRASGQGSWTTACTVSASPYSCAWDTTATPPGSQELRAVLLDGSGGTTSSSTRTVTVSNPAPNAADVQAINGGVLGRPDAGDRLVLTYSTLVATGTIKTGWNGGVTTVEAVLHDAKATGSADPSRDNLVLPSTALGTVSFAQNYVTAARTATFTGSTMVAGTTTVGGRPVTVVTVTLGVTTDPVNTLSKPGPMIWTPSAAVRGLDGQVCSTTPRTESGTSDKDL